MDNFNGVATKYLANYMYWFKWIELFKTDKDATFDIMADNIKKIETDDTGVTPVLTGEAFYVQPFLNYSSFEVLTGTLLGIKEEQLANFKALLISSSLAFSFP